MIYVHGDNILRLLDILGKLSSQHNWNEAWLLAINMVIRVSSRTAERLKTWDLRKLGNIRKILKLHTVIT